jgi:hypothetical protein
MLWKWLRDPREALGWLAKSRVALLALFAIGLAVRLAAIPDAHFDGDESSFWEVGVTIAEGRGFPLVGPAISGSPAALPGPLFFLISALPQLFTTDPYAGALFIALLNLAGLGLFYLAVRDGWDEKAAFLFLILAVASPWTVVYADRMWAGNLFLFMCAAVTYCVVRMLRHDYSRAALVLGFALVAWMQIHLSTAHLWIISILPLAICRPRIRYRWLITGAILGAFTFAPYLVHELRTDFSNTRLMLQHAPGPPRQASILGGLYLYLFGFSTTDISYLITHGYWFPFEHFAFWSHGGSARMSAFYGRLGAAPFLWVFHVVSWALAAAGVALGAIHFATRPERIRRLRESPIALMFACAMLSIALLYTASRKGGYAHYVTMLGPFGFLPSVFALLALMRIRPAGYLALLFAILFPVAGTLALRGYYRLDPRSSLSQQKKIVRFILDHSEGRPFSLRFGFSYGRPWSYIRLARLHFKAPWPSRTGAPDAFHVVPVEAYPSFQSTPGFQGGLKLDTLAIVHVRRGP